MDNGGRSLPHFFSRQEILSVRELLSITSTSIPNLLEDRVAEATLQRLDLGSFDRERGSIFVAVNHHPSSKFQVPRTVFLKREEGSRQCGSDRHSGTQQGSLSHFMNQSKSCKSIFLFPSRTSQATNPPLLRTI